MLLKKLGGAVGWAVDILLLDEDESKETKQGEKTLRERKAEAVECMAYVRDVLSRGGKGEIEEERLIGEEEYKRRRRNKEMEKANLPSISKPVLPPPRIASSETPSRATAKTHTSPAATEPATPISSLSKSPVLHPPTNSTSSNKPFSSVSSRVNQTPPPRSKPPMTKAPVIVEPKKLVPPWEHTPSNFSGDSPYAAESLPRLPPASTTATPRKSASYSIPRIPHPSTNETPPESTHADPLGVLR